MFSRSVCAVAFALSLTGINGALAADELTEEFVGTKPAVSGLNGKLEFGYFYADIEVAPGIPGVAGAVNADADAFIAQGAISAPIGHQFGIQLDAGAFTGDIGPFDIEGAGGAVHIFWRNPDVALLGGYVHYVNTDIGPLVDIDNVRYGAEAEIYLNRLSLEGFVGADYLDVTNGAITADDTFFSGRAVAAYYPQDNLRIFAGVQHAFNETSFFGGGEYLFDTGWQAEPAVYARAAVGEDSSNVMAGLKFYFGERRKSLIRRHREDDPQIVLFDNIGAAGTAACGTTGTPPPMEMRDAAIQRNGYLNGRVRVPRSGCVPSMMMPEMPVYPTVE